MQKPSVGDKELQGKGKLIDFKSIQLPKDNEEIIDGETFNAEAFVQSIVKQIEERNYESHHKELMECLLNLPPLEVMDNPITINQIINHQARDIPLQKKIMSDPDRYQHHGMQGYEVIYKVEDNSN